MSVVTIKPLFYPPKLNPLFTRLIQSISYPGAYFAYQLELAVSAEDIAKIKAIEDDRIVYLPNHVTLDDGVVLFLLSARLGQLFHYIVAHEAFQGLVGTFLQHIGAYSIRRGLGDRASIAQTIKVLQQPACRVVIFPEGGCSHQNDKVMPFRSGAIQLPFRAMSQLVKNEGILPDFYLVPLSLKYRYTQPMERIIAESLHRLETALGISPVSSDLYGRLRTVAEQILVNLEKEYGIESKSTKQKDWNQRLEQLKKHVLHECEQKLNLTSIPQVPARERVYKIQSLIEANEQELSEREEKTYEAIYRSAFRLLNFNAIYDGYVAEQPTPERFLDTITVLEREVFHIDHPQPKGHRRVHISIGEPINLKNYYQSYQQDKTTTGENLTQQLQQTVQQNLDLLASN